MYIYRKLQKISDFVKFLTISVICAYIFHPEARLHTAETTTFPRTSPSTKKITETAASLSLNQSFRPMQGFNIPSSL